VREAWFFLAKGVFNPLKRVGRPPYPNSLIILLALIRSYFKLPSSHWERRRMLRDRYRARERHLHEAVFYEGYIDIEDTR
jgi:hypothetical protein